MKKLLTMVVLGAAATAAHAQDKGTVDTAKDKVAMCIGCHGIEGYKNAYPNYSVPKLSGQHAGYLVAALNAYKSGERGHGTMHAQAVSMSLCEAGCCAACVGAGAASSSVGQSVSDSIMKDPAHGSIICIRIELFLLLKQTKRKRK